MKKEYNFYFCNIMHYVIFGKYHPQTKPLLANIKVYLWDKNNLVAMFAHKYLNHKPKANLYNQDVYFLEKTKVYKLDPNQYESNGDVIMDNFKYPEIEISNISLNDYCKTLYDSNITIQLINI